MVTYQLSIDLEKMAFKISMSRSHEYIIYDIENKIYLDENIQSIFIMHLYFLLSIVTVSIEFEFYISFSELKILYDDIFLLSTEEMISSMIIIDYFIDSSDRVVINFKLLFIFFIQLQKLL